MWAKNKHSLFTHIYIYFFFFPLICCPELSSELSVLVLPCWNWKLSCGWETLCWGKRLSSIQSLLSTSQRCQLPLTSGGHWLSDLHTWQHGMSPMPFPEDKSAALNWRVLRSKNLGVEGQQPQAEDLWVPFGKMHKVCRVQRLRPTGHILAQALIPLFCTSRTPPGQDCGIISNSSSVQKSKLT